MKRPDPPVFVNVFEIFDVNSYIDLFMLEEILYAA